ncbi:DUF2497 domain-containing protein [Rubritepida flocculans]|uniref:DUF2497 domain-containing protein n=1 Tax=Rubritepida flocculans TaxID=182403 RepID=UPI000406E873|nr:DUF2497 domain-containing protein [Rubritepida flocculans]
MSGTPPASDPSMDDILASIRKILNEDDPPPSAAPPPAAPEAEEPLVLTSEMMIAPPPVTAAVAPEPAPMPAPMPAPLAAPAAPSLVAPAAAAAAAAALGELSRAVGQERATPIARTPGITLEEMVREELRPMLKQWLDENLAPMVERLVRAEIERVMAQAR